MLFGNLLAKKPPLVDSVDTSTIASNEYFDVIIKCITENPLLDCCEPPTEAINMRAIPKDRKVHLLWQFGDEVIAQSQDFRKGATQYVKYSIDLPDAVEIIGYSEKSLIIDLLISLRLEGGFDYQALAEIAVLLDFEAIDELWQELELHRKQGYEKRRFWERQYRSKFDSVPVS